MFNVTATLSFTGWFLCRGRVGAGGWVYVYYVYFSLFKRL